MSSSAAAALNRQNELEAAIEAQKAVLQDLMSQHKEAQHRLNLFIDPIWRDYRWKFNISYYSTLHRWSLFRTQLPTLKHYQWPFLAFVGCGTTLPWPPQNSGVESKWIRCREVPTTLSSAEPGWAVRGVCPYPLQSVQDLLTRYRHQLEDLTLSLARTHYLSSSYPLIIFKTWGDDSSLPCLKTLSIKSLEGRTMKCFLGHSPGLKVLQVAPNLASFSIQNTFYDSGEYEGEDEDLLQPITLSFLTDLRLGQPRSYASSGEGGASSVVLRFFILPALQHLSISYFDIPADVFISFLARSSAHLKSMDFAPPPHEWPVADCLRLIPTITDLQLSAPFDHPLHPWDQDRFLSFLQIMSTTPDLLPSLRRLTLSTFVPVTIDYDELLRMLIVRSTRNLQCFSLYFLNLNRLRSVGADMPNDQVRSGLLKLANGGMKIHVGPEYRNLL
ncbi:hypothetical protein R3P38DRAFT_3575361 [Favolaschia claudopus]|uniref:F-box domain-containing protein n=1 Tax=Favolaschia claudopus TaxID=2862362 RepID=A0AAW0ALS7_9AGAR